MKRSIFVCFLVTLVFSLTATAQMMQPMKKGEELKKLEFLVGDWASIDEMMFDPSGEPMKVEASSSFSWILGDVWLEQKYSADMGPMGIMHGSGRITWDAGKKMYVSYWIDNYASVSMTSTGSFDENGNLVFTGTSEYEGNTFQSRYSWTKKDDNTLYFTMENSMDGENWMPAMKSTMTRK